MKYDEDVNINDYYKIKKDWNDLKKLIEATEKDLDLFLGYRKVKRRCGPARRKIVKMKTLLKKISKNILKTKQDFESDYS